MINNAVNGTLDIDGTTMDYISFGKGKRNLVMVKGLDDGLATVKGQAVPCSIMSRKFGEQFRVYVFSQKTDLPEVYSTREMADDLYRAMQLVQIESADILGVSMGGMIAQHLAIDHPDIVNKLVLAVTLARLNDVMMSVQRNWLDMIESEDYAGYMEDCRKKIYTERYLRKHRMRFSKNNNCGMPDDLSRLKTLINACLTHSSYEELGRVQCPTFIIGGMKDRIVTEKASEEIAEKIPESRLFIYGELGHAVFEEAKDFKDRVISFLNSDISE